MTSTTPAAAPPARISRQRRDCTAPLFAHDAARRRRDAAKREAHVVAHHDREAGDQPTEHVRRLPPSSTSATREERERQGRTVLPEVGAVEQRGRKQTRRTRTRASRLRRRPTRDSRRAAYAASTTLSTGISTTARAPPSCQSGRPTSTSGRLVTCDPAVTVRVRRTRSGDGAPPESHRRGPVAEVGDPGLLFGHRLHRGDASADVGERSRPRIAEPRDGERDDADDQEREGQPAPVVRARASEISEPCSVTSEP